MNAELHWTEADRLAALDAYGVLDTPPEPEFDDLVRLAADLLDAPMAAINLIAENRQWFKAELGFGIREMPLDDSICARVLLQAQDVVVPDLAQDKRFECNPLVTSGPTLRFYAGQLLRTAGGLPLGTLCVLDTSPRPEGLTQRQRFALKTLARQAMSQLDLRRAMRQQERLRAEQARSEALRRQTLDSVTDHAILSTDLQGRIQGWNTGATNILGWSETEILGQDVGLVYVPEDRQRRLPDAERAATLESGRTSFERLHARKDGSAFWALGDMIPLRNEQGIQTGFVLVMRDRTEQREADAALERLSERYRLAARATNDVVWDWNLETNVILWNEALHAAFGWRPDQVKRTGSWWLAQIHPEDRDRVEQSLRTVIASSQETLWTAEYRFRRADGSYAFVLDRGYLMRSGGRALRMVGAMLDQTARRQGSAALRESEDRLRLALAAARIGTFDYQPSTGVLTWDDRCRELFGISPGRPVSYESSFIPGLHPDDRDLATQAVQRALETGGSGAFAAEYRSIGLEDGIERWVSARGETFFHDGKAPRLIGTVIDISDRKRIEEQQQTLNSLLRQQVEERTQDRDRMWMLSEDVMLVAGFDASISAVNPAWTTVLGWERDELLGGSFMDFVHPDDAEATIAEAGKLAQGIKTLRFENRYRHKDGTYRWFSWTAVPDDTFIHAVGRDVQKEKEAAEALQRSEEQLRQSQKMEAVGQLTGGLAHDFNNLLTGVIGALELLGTRLGQGRLKEAERYIEAAQGAARRAAGLTHRLLAFARRQTLDPKPTDANRLIRGMEELIRRTMGPEIEVGIVPASGLWPTLVDPNQLENAILNLSINARDAMPHGGCLTVETANIRLETRDAQESDMQPGQYVEVRVTDTGSGMSQDVIDKAFEPFFTTKPMGHGTGLGLSMIYGFAKQSGGQVRIQSKLGAGTTMRLYLPRHAGVAEEAEPEPDLAEAPRARAGETVLVVDDEDTIRMLVTEVLEELGYAAIEATDAASGLQVLQSGARVDLLVTDVGLPGGMNGRQMADAARVKRPDLKVLFITGYAENAVVGNGHLEPGMHVMTKPFLMEALASRIKELIATG